MAFGLANWVSLGVCVVFLFIPTIFGFVWVIFLGGLAAGIIKSSFIITVLVLLKAMQKCGCSACGNCACIDELLGVLMAIFDHFLGPAWNRLDRCFEKPQDEDEDDTPPSSPSSYPPRSSPPSPSPAKFSPPIPSPPRSSPPRSPPPSPSPARFSPPIPSPPRSSPPRSPPPSPSPARFSPPSPSPPSPSPPRSSPPSSSSSSTSSLVQTV